MTCKPTALPLHLFVSLLLTLCLFNWGCEGTDAFNSIDPNATVQRIINEQQELTTFADALQRVQTDNLQNLNVKFTLFAPSNEAFATYLQVNGYASLAQVPEEELNDLVRYHIVLGERTSSRLDSALALNSRSNKKIFVHKANNIISLNNQAQIINGDLIAVNGVVHIINSVLKAPAHNLSEYIMSRNEEEFNLLKAAINHSNLLPYFSRQQSVTFFAPTDAAFAASSKYSSIEDIENSDPDSLRRVLLYHVLPRHRFTNMFRQDTVLTQMGKRLALNGANRTVKGFGNDEVTPLRQEESNVITSNGILHAIDALLLPEPQE